MNPAILGVIGPGFLNQVPTLVAIGTDWVQGAERSIVADRP